MITLSYIVATRNRLPFLRITLSKLLENLQPDEEVVVVDGDSTDGSKEYLQDLYQQGKIQTFISEADRNQAHAWNKAMLLAQGILVKKIIDDDVFCYKAIAACKRYMLHHEQVDVVISDDLSASVAEPSAIRRNTRLPQYQEWAKQKVPSFTFGDVHMLIRKSALAYIGLYDTSFIMMDWEYALRISYLQCRIVYYTGCNALNVAHEDTVTAKRNMELIRAQGKIGMQKYDYAGDSADISNWSKAKIFAGKLLYKAKEGKGSQNAVERADLAPAYEELYKTLDLVNSLSTGQFITRG